MVEATGGGRFEVAPPVGDSKAARIDASSIISRNFLEFHFLIGTSEICGDQIKITIRPRGSDPAQNRPITPLEMPWNHVVPAAMPRPPISECDSDSRANRQVVVYQHPRAVGLNACSTQQPCHASSFHADVYKRFCSKDMRRNGAQARG